MNEVVNPLHWISVSYYLSYGPPLIIFQGFTTSLIGQFGSFALLTVTGGTGIAYSIAVCITHTVKGNNEYYTSEPEVGGTFFRAITQSAK